MENKVHTEKQCCCENPPKLDEVSLKMPVDEQTYDVSELFKVLGDPTRLKILFALLSEEMCVCDIAQLLEMTQSAISHQLRVLKQARLVKYRRDGKSLIYSVSDEHVSTMLNMGIEHISE